MSLTTMVQLKYLSLVTEKTTYPFKIEHFQFPSISRSRVHYSAGAYTKTDRLGTIQVCHTDTIEDILHFLYALCRPFSAESARETFCSGRPPAHRTTDTDLSCTMSALVVLVQHECPNPCKGKDNHSISHTNPKKKIVKMLVTFKQ